MTGIVQIQERHRHIDKTWMRILYQKDHTYNDTKRIQSFETNDDNNGGGGDDGNDND